MTLAPRLVSSQPNQNVPMGWVENLILQPLLLSRSKYMLLQRACLDKSPQLYPIDDNTITIVPGSF